MTISPCFANKAIKCCSHKPQKATCHDVLSRSLTAAFASNRTQDPDSEEHAPESLRAHSATPAMMMVHHRRNAYALLALAVFTALPTDACSDFRLNTSSASVITGRTMDFAVDLNSVVEVIPRGSTFQELPVLHYADCPDYKWASKLGFVALNMFGVNVAADGMNEKGLSAAELYLVGSEYPVPAKPLETRQKPIVTAICTFILGNFATVDEVREGLDHVQIAEYDEQIAAFLVGKKAELGRVPLHISVHDATGKSLVIEFLKGKVVLYDNVNQVLTNEPPLNEQLAALEKNGFSTVPGGYGATERFIRLSVLNRAVPFGYRNSPDTSSFLAATQEQRDVADTLHLLNTVVRPPSAEATEWSIVRDHGRKKLYIRSSVNQVLRQVDLNKLDFSDPASRRAIPVTFGNWFVDVTDALLDESNRARTRDLPARTKIEALIKSQQQNGPPSSAVVSRPPTSSAQAFLAMLPQAPTPEDNSSLSSFLLGCVCGGVFMSFVVVGSQFLVKRVRQRGYQAILDSSSSV